jgi:RNA polymerase sigma-70 factor (ECF subfamily)
MSGNAITTDKKLVELTKNGDQKAFSELVLRHQQGLLRLCLRFVKDLDMAKDVAQESFIKAYERIASFEERASFKSWLFQIAINTAKNKLRSKRDHHKDINEVQIGVSAMAELGLVQNAVSHVLAKLVEELPEKQKIALKLRIYEDLSFKEIAEIMKCPYDTAKANYRHALLKLKQMVEKDEDLTTKNEIFWFEKNDNHYQPMEEIEL